MQRALTSKQQVGEPHVTYLYKWMYRLPVHYTKVKFMQEFLS